MDRGGEATEDDLAALAATGLVALLAREADGRVRWASAGASALLGAPAAEVVGQTLADLGWRALEHDEAVVLGAAGREETGTALLAGRVGDRRRVLRARAGPGELLLLDDVTGLVAAAEAAREEAAWLTRALRTAQTGVWSWDVATGAVRWSDGVEAVFGLAPGSFDASYEAYLALIPLAHRPALLAVIEDTLAGRTEGYRFEHPVGEGPAARWLECRGQARRDAAGQAVGLFGTVHDVTERRRAEDALRGSREQLRAVLDTAPSFVLMLAPDGQVEFINRTYDTGSIEQADVVGSDVTAWVPPDERPRMRALIERAVATGTPQEGEFAGQGPDGEAAWFQANLGPVWRDGRVVGVTMVSTPITALRLALERLRESEARLRSAAESFPFAFWIRDRAGRLVLQNAPSLALDGDLDGAARDLAPDERARAEARVDRALAGEVVRLEEEVARGAVRRHVSRVLAPVRDPGGAVLGVLGVDLDLTDQRRLEADMAQAAKEESLGRLASSVAHDFNNLLAAIVGCASLARRSLGAEHTAQRELEGLLDAADRGAALTRQLLDFARRSRPVPQPLDLSRAVERLAATLLPRLLGPAIRLELDLAPELPRVVLDPSQLDQLVLNLAANARDAMPAGGRVRVRTRALPAGGPDGPPHACATLELTDEGAGMPPEVLARALEPFFSTKGAAGTGLGLSTCNAIARAAGGRVSLRSAPGAGTTVTVELPATSDGARATADDGDAAAAPPATDAGAPPRDAVLVAEDDAVVRAILANVLLERGLDVTAVGDGREALARLAERDFDLVVSDVSMPRMGGLELADHLRRAHPALPVLLVTGDPVDALVAAGHDVLAKPFPPDTLLRRVEAAVERAHGRSLRPARAGQGGPGG